MVRALSLADTRELARIRTREATGGYSACCVCQTCQDAFGLTSLHDIGANSLIGDANGRARAVGCLRELGDLSQCADCLGQSWAGDLERTFATSRDGHDPLYGPRCENPIKLAATLLWHVGVQHQHEADLVALGTDDTNVDGFREHYEPCDTGEVRAFGQGQGNRYGCCCRVVGDMNRPAATGH